LVVGDIQDKVIRMCGWEEEAALTDDNPADRFHQELGALLNRYMQERDGYISDSLFIDMVGYLGIMFSYVGPERRPFVRRIIDRCLKSSLDCAEEEARKVEMLDDMDTTTRH